MAKVANRFEQWAADSVHRIRGYNPWEIAIDVGRSANRHRVVGLAAEMAFFASLALVPFTVAVGATFGYSARLVGAEQVNEFETAAVHLMALILSPSLVNEVAGPFVRAHLEREAGGLALAAMLPGLWLASRVFVPALYGLDLAYGVTEHRPAFKQRLIALALAVASLIVVTIVVVMLVLGPLLGSARVLAFRFRLGGAFEVFWQVARWPVVVLIVAAFMLLVYRYAPDAHMRWRTALPGAVVGVVLWLSVAVGFRLYLAAGIGVDRSASVEEQALVVVSRTVGALVATVVWTFLSSLAVLAGGEVNAAVDRVRRARREADGVAGRDADGRPAG